MVESLLNVVVRLIYGRSHYDYVLDLLKERLHWLRVPQRITFKCCLLVYKSLHGLAPSYIAEFCIRKATTRSRTGLCSDIRDDLVVSRTTSKFSDRSIAMVGPTAWNSLQQSIKDTKSVNIFKSKLKNSSVWTII